jgi:hypothetical protein
MPGDHELGDLREPVQALVQFYRAFNNRDVEMMDRTWGTPRRWLSSARWPMWFGVGPRFVAPT